MMATASWWPSWSAFFQQSVDGGPDPAIGLGVIVAKAFDGTIWQGAFFDVGGESGDFRVDS